jgi:hypothetical protein
VVAPVPSAIDALLPFISATVPLFNCPGTRSHPARRALSFVINTAYVESSLISALLEPLNTANPYLASPVVGRLPTTTFGFAVSTEPV